MKRILAAALAAFASLAFGATTLPPLMINPAGSTAGQAILSTGSTGQPVWGAVPLTGITGTLAIANGGTGATTQAAALASLLGSSTVPIANGGTAAATAAAARTNLGLGTAATQNTGTSGATVPLLSTANTWTLAQAFTVRPTFNSATPWDSANLASPAATTGTLAQFASTTSAQLAGVLSDETGSGVVVMNNSPALTTPVVAGITNAVNPAAGKVGEHLTGAASAVSITSGTPIGVTSVSLTAGYWMITAVVTFTPAATTVMQTQYGGISTGSVALSGNQYFQLSNNNTAAGQGSIFPTPVIYQNISASTTAYCVAEGIFTTSTATASCKIDAIRIQ